MYLQITLDSPEPTVNFNLTTVLNLELFQTSRLTIINLFLQEIWLVDPVIAKFMLEI